MTGSGTLPSNGEHIFICLATQSPEI